RYSARRADRDLRQEESVKEADVLAMRSVVVILAVAGSALATQGQKTGSPEDHLPSDITQLTAFGERASWSPDGQRIAFMSKSFGDAFVVEGKTKTIGFLP